MTTTHAPNPIAPGPTPPKVQARRPTLAPEIQFAAAAGPEDAPAADADAEDDKQGHPLAILAIGVLRSRWLRSYATPCHQRGIAI